MGCIRTLDQRAPKRRPTVDKVQHLVQATTRAQAIGIVPGIRLLSGPLARTEASDEVAMIVRGKGMGIETARGGTPDLGIIQSLINYRLIRYEVTFA